MKKILFILFAAIGLMACETRAPYITTDSPITFDTLKVMGTQMTVTAQTEDDRAYYYFNMMAKEDMDTIAIEDYHLETLILDMLYQEYLSWRFKYLTTNEEYIASFESRTFYRGKAQRFFTNLKPETEYVIYGFCINPDNIQRPIGPLYKKIVRTTAVQYGVSPMVIDFMVDVDEFTAPDMEGWGVYMASVRPSEYGRATKEPYAFDIVSDAQLEHEYHGSVREYADAMVYKLQNDEDGSVREKYLHRDITSYGEMVRMNQGYWMIAAAYRISYPKAIYTRHFVATPGLHLPYGHDEKTDYSND